MQYIGEHPIFGQAGHFLVILSFVAALLSSVSYFFNTLDSSDRSWLRLGRSSFLIHSLSVLGILSILFWIIFNHYFEYHYVWEHSSKSLPFKYILACFWEGQEGSFLLWTFWHLILGWVLIFKGKEWEGPVMTVIAVVQVFLTSMVLGIYIGDFKLGSNPFLLMREHPDMVNLPFLKVADYALKLDGRGLNPLLQNYWMVIHPPTLFLGFAATVVPFAFAIAALWKNKFNEWIKPVLPWTFFAIMILGTGILMGGAWAYESLSFGGFWAWDPVENASLVPWLTLVGAGHVMLVFKKKSSGLITGLVLALVSFLLVLYSTFLTRSGILGDSSVHAFTDLGMSGQLLVYLLFFVLLAIFLFIIKWKQIPKSSSEEATFSREFWMFLGSLILLISCFQITFTTSIPVINKVFGTKLAPPANVISHYNAWQIPIATLISLMIGATQFLKWKKNAPAEFLNKILASLLSAFGITLLLAIPFRITNLYYLILLFSSSFAVTGNLFYIIRFSKGKIGHWGSSIAHVGFGMILLGALISTSQSTPISKNLSGFNLGKDFPNNENIMLTKGDTLPMGGFLVSFQGKRREGVNIYYNIEYFKQENGKILKEFSLSPVIQTNPRMGNVAEPDTRHYLTRDIYTHITYADPSDFEHNTHDSLYKKPVTKIVSIGDTISTSNSLIVVKELDKNVSREQLGEDLATADLAIGVKLLITDVNKKQHIAEPILAIVGNTLYSPETIVEELGLKIYLKKIIPETGKLEFSLAEKKTNSREFIIMKAIVFPGINILWLGSVLMVLGTLIAIRKRIKKK